MVMLSIPSCGATESSSTQFSESPHLSMPNDLSITLDQHLSVHHYYLLITVHTTVTHDTATNDTTNDRVRLTDVTAPSDVARICCEEGQSWKLGTQYLDTIVDSQI